ncbi:rhamnogalacturonan acetylesterase [Arthrobacter citreus]|uniref:Rhamnogalacturonan acetylesterase n=1 Tax=Arthrobacter citreus TaxID=1670 RepID=A0ABZ2ZSM5_9MICC
MSGWGPELAGFLEAGDIVLNFAKGGATTASFAAEELWQDLLKELEPQNFVLIQFGHNDQKHPQLLAPEGGYTERLAEFVADVRDRGGVPVLCTSVERCWFSNARLSPSHGGYPAAVRALAAREQVPVIDLTVFSSWLYESLGETAALALFTEQDKTHFCVRGAREIASYVARALAAVSGRDARQPPLGPNL